MIHLFILAVHLLATIAKLVRLGGVRAVESQNLFRRGASAPKCRNCRQIRRVDPHHSSEKTMSDDLTKKVPKTATASIPARIMTSVTGRKNSAYQPIS